MVKTNRLFRPAALLTLIAICLTVEATAATSDSSTYHLHDEVQVRRLAPDIWLHITWKRLANGYPFPANGLIVHTDSTSFLIDTGYNPAQAAILLDWLEKVRQKPVTLALVTHAHDDRMGGMPALLQRKIPVLANIRSLREADRHSLTAATHYFQRDTSFSFGRHAVHAVFPGAGHAPDNIVVWLPRSSIFFGGCAVKSIRSQSLGYTADADIESWHKLMTMLQREYQTAELVVPGHGAIGTKELLLHTYGLLESAIGEHE